MSFGLIVLTGAQKKVKFTKQSNGPPITIIGTYIKQLYHKSSHTSHKHITCILKHAYPSHMHFEINHKLIDILNEPSNPKPNPKSKTKIKINFITYLNFKSKRNLIPYHIQNPSPRQTNSITYHIFLTKCKTFSFEKINSWPTQRTITNTRITNTPWWTCRCPLKVPTKDSTL